ncbi:RNA polymerase sigma factor [Myxococcota bacterium]
MLDQPRHKNPNLLCSRSTTDAWSVRSRHPEFIPVCDRAAISNLVAEVVPVVRARSARAVARWHAHREQNRDVKQEAEEVSQEILADFWANGVRILRGWNPARGLSLYNFLGLVAERQASKILQNRERCPWADANAAAVDWQRLTTSETSPETIVAARELMARLIPAARKRLSPLGFRVFELLLLQESTVESVCAETGLSRGAVYVWHHRLRKLAHSVELTPH